MANKYILNGKRIYITLPSSIILLFPDELEYHESQESAYEHYEYGVALAELGEIECSGKECYAYGKVDGIVGWRAEVLLIHKQHGSRSYQSYDCI